MAQPETGFTSTLTPLEQEIRQRIATDGPISIADYMISCLTHPKHGYYTTSHPLGGSGPHEQSGDFITAPEVSQMFGELIGVWCMEVWHAMGRPDAFNLVEIGPGRGTLMKDLLRSSNALPAFQQAMRLHLIEVSPTLIYQQKQALQFHPSTKWHADIEGLPKRPSIVIANELLDALPFRQWCKWVEHWQERAVGLVDGQLNFVLRPNRLHPQELPEGHGSQPQGTLFETAPAREAFVTRLGDMLADNGGAALMIDYGHLNSGFGETFQAVANHAYTGPLKDAGEVDLTSHVDFAPLVAAAREAGCVVPEPINQGSFLLTMGLLERAGNLGQKQSEPTRRTLEQAVERLAGPEQMGELFKVMALGNPESFTGPIPGFSVPSS